MIIIVIAGGCLFGLYLTVKGIIFLFRRKLKSGLACILVGLPLFLWLAASLLLPCVISDVGPSPRTRCMLNLSQIGKACYMHAMDHDEAFPTSFRQITNFLPDPDTFICPPSGHKPGPLDLVDQWTDYILVTNLSIAPRGDLILAYCKPENNHAKGCNVLFVNLCTFWASSDQFSNLTCNVESHSRVNTRDPQPSSPAYPSKATDGLTGNAEE